MEEEKKPENKKNESGNNKGRGGFYMPSIHGSRGIDIPNYFRKKKFRWEFFDELEKAAKSEPVFKDEYGEYREGVFLYKTVVVFVDFKDGMWRCSVRSEYEVSPLLAREVRYKYIPDHCAMAVLMLSREESKDKTVVTMYEIPQNIEDKKSEE